MNVLTKRIQRLSKTRLRERDRRIRGMGKPIDRWSNKLRRRILGIVADRRGGPEGAMGAIRSELSDATKQLELVLWKEFEGFLDWAWDSAAANLVSSFPLDFWLLRLMPKKPMLGIEARRNGEGLTEGFDFESPLDPVLDGRASEQQSRALVQEVLVPPPSQHKVSQIIRNAPWPDGLDWPSRIKTQWAVDMDRLSSTIAQGYAGGETTDQLAKRLRPFCDENKGINYKAKRLARTEGARISEDAQREMYAEVPDLVQGIQAFNSQDTAVREKHWRWQPPGGKGTIFYPTGGGIHVARSGQMAGETLPYFPAGPHCRCYSMPVLIDDMQKDLAGADYGAYQQSLDRFKKSGQWMDPKSEVGKRIVRAGKKTAKAKPAPKPGTVEAFIDDILKAGKSDVSFANLGREPGFDKLFVSKQDVFFNEKFQPTIVIHDVEATAKGKGALTKALNRLKQQNLAIKVENVQTPRLMAGLERRGFRPFGKSSAMWEPGKAPVPKVRVKPKAVVKPKPVPKPAPSTPKPRVTPKPEQLPKPKSALKQAIQDTADEWEIEPRSLSEAVDYLYGEKATIARGAQKAKAAVHKMTGLSSSDIRALENRGFDYSSGGRIGGKLGDRVGKLDVWATEASRQYPELALGNPDDMAADLTAKLWEVMREPRIRIPQKMDTNLLREAAELVHNTSKQQAAVQALDPFVDFASNVPF